MSKPPEATPTANDRDLAMSLGLRRTTGEAYYRRSLKAYETGDLENALLDISEAIYHDQNFAEYYATRGLYYLTDNKPAEAERDLNYALKLNRRLWLAHYCIGMLRFNEGDFQTALELFDNAMRFARAARKDNRPEIYYYRAITYYALKEAEKALKDIDQAISLLDDSDRRLRDARVWRKEIEKDLPESVRKALKAEAKKARSAKDSATDADPLSVRAEIIGELAKNAPLIPGDATAAPVKESKATKDTAAAADKSTKKARSGKTATGENTAALNTKALADAAKHAPLIPDDDSSQAGGSTSNGR